MGNAKKVTMPTSKIPIPGNLASQTATSETPEQSGRGARNHSRPRGWSKSVCGIGEIGHDRSVPPIAQINDAVFDVAASAQPSFKAGDAERLQKIAAPTRTTRTFACRATKPCSWAFGYCPTPTHSTSSAECARKSTSSGGSCRRACKRPSRSTRPNSRWPATSQAVSPSTLGRSGATRSSPPASTTCSPPKA